MTTTAGFSVGDRVWFWWPQTVFKSRGTITNIDNQVVTVQLFYGTLVKVNASVLNHDEPSGEPSDEPAR